jgi:hypothetical protein
VRSPRRATISPGGWRALARNQTQERGFAAAIEAYKADAIAGVDFKRQPAEERHAAGMRIRNMMS